MYEGKLKQGNSTVDFDDRMPVEAYWLKIDEDNMARRRARGDMEDRVELSWIERKAAYGVSCSMIQSEKNIPKYPDDRGGGYGNVHAMYLTAFKSKPLYMRMNNVVLAEIESTNTKQSEIFLKSFSMKKQFLIPHQKISSCILSDCV